MPRTFLAIAALLVLAPALADDTPRASIPYSNLMDAQKLTDKLKDLDQLNVSTSIGSDDPQVQPSGITLEATLRSGQVVSIPIAADGTFTVPSSPELAQEDPLFVSNLPKGTMSFRTGFIMKPPTVTAQRYADLMRRGAQFNVGMVRLGLTEMPKAQGLLFAFNEGGHTLTLHTKKKDKMLRSETREQARKYLKANHLPDDGTSAFIYVAPDDKLLKENPQTEFDVLPVEVVPAM